MSYQITDVSGVTSLMPNHQKMTEIVDEMLEQELDEVFTDVIMSSRTGYSISLYPNRCAVLENPQNVSFTLTNLERDDLLMLWLQLASENITAILQLDWVKEEDQY